MKNVIYLFVALLTASVAAGQTVQGKASSLNPNTFQLIWPTPTQFKNANGITSSARYYASGVPSDSLGVDGDTYINTANGSEYQKASSVWGVAKVSFALKATSAAGYGITNGANIDAWGAKTIYSGLLAITSGKTLTATSSLTLTGTDGATLNIGAGGTLGTNAYTSTSYQPQASILTTLAALANGSGYLQNNGSGVLGWGAGGGGDFSSNTASSVDGEIVLFSSTGGKTGKRATGTGLAKITAGVLGTGTAGTDYVAPGGAAGAIDVTTQSVDNNTTKAASTAFVIAQAASATPLIDGTAAVGSSTRFARGDHVHPTDSTRLPVNAPTSTGKFTTAASATGTAGFNLPHGAAPTSPVDGDFWTTSAGGLFGRINGATINYGSGGGTGANPSATIGLTAVNGVASTYLRSDGAPALGVGIAPHWTAQHWFDLNPRVSDNTAPTTGTSALALGTNYTVAAHTSNYSFTSITGTSGRSKIHLVGCNGTATFTWTTAAQRAGDAVGTTTTITPSAGDHTFVFYYDTVTSAYYYTDDQTGPLDLAGGAPKVSGVLPVTNGGTGGATVAAARVALNVTTNAIASLAIDWALSGSHSKTLAANSTFTFSNATDGQTIIVALTNTASNYTVTWPTVSWSGGTTPTQTVGAKTDVYTFTKIGSTIYGSAVQNF